MLPALRTLPDVEVVVVGDLADYREAEHELRIAVTTSSSLGGADDAGGPIAQDRDWFDLAITVRVEDRPVPLALLLRALAAGEDRLLLPDGLWLRIDTPALSGLRALIEEARALQDSPTGPLRISRFQAGMWDAQRRTPCTPSCAPTSTKGSAGWSDCARRGSEGCWAAEATEFVPDLRVRTIDRTRRKRGTDLADLAADADVVVVVTSYALFRIEFDDYAALGWSVLVLDEAQMVKNHESVTYACAKRLGAPVKLAITGTPLENTVMELWALLGLVAPGLFPSPRRFTEFYRVPIERDGDGNRLALLRRRIRPLMLLRRLSLDPGLVDPA